MGGGRGARGRRWGHWARAPGAIMVVGGGPGSGVAGAVVGEARVGCAAYAMTRWRCAPGARPAGHQLRRWRSAERVGRALSVFPVALNGALVKTNGVAGVAAALGGTAGLVSGVAGLVSGVLPGVAGVAAALDGAAGLVSGDAGVAAAIAGVAGFFSGAAVVSCVAALRIQIVLQVLRPLMKK